MQQMCPVGSFLEVSCHCFTYFWVPARVLDVLSQRTVISADFGAQWPCK